MHHTRLQKCINNVTEESFALWWKHSIQDTEEAVPHFTKALPALAQTDGLIHTRCLCKGIDYYDKDPIDMSHLCFETLYRLKFSIEALRWMGVMFSGYCHLLTALLRCLKAGTFQVRYAAAEALGNMGEKAAAHPDVIPMLVECLKVDDMNVCYAAAGALGKIGEKAAAHPDVLPALVECLNHKNRLIQKWALWALRQMGELAAAYATVLPALMLRLKDEDIGVLWNATWEQAIVLYYIIAQGYLQLLKEGDEDIVRHIIMMLGMQKDKNTQKVAFLGDEFWPEVGVSYSDVLPVVAQCLKDEDMEVRQSAARVLGEMGEKALTHPDVIPTLVECLKMDKFLVVRLAAAYALGWRWKLGDRCFASDRILSSFALARGERM